MVEITEKDRIELNNIKKAVFLQSNMGFLQSVLCSTDLDFMEADEMKTPSVIYTDGISIKINKDMWVELDFNSKLYSICSVLWHNGLLHVPRGEGKDPKLWQIACDIVVANLLKTIPSGMFNIDRNVYRYSEETADTLYEKLVKNSEDNSSNNPMPSPFFQNNNSSSGQGNKSIVDISQDLYNDPNVSQQEFTQKTMDLVNATKIAGDVPGDLKSTIDTFLNPKIKFGPVLKKYLLDVLDNEQRSFKRPNRRYDDMCLPSICGEDERLIEINCYIDCSGSVSEKEIMVFNSEIKAIKNTYNPKVIRLINFDTEIHSVIEMKSEEAFTKINIEGRGGTDLREVYKHIQETKPTLSLIMSDMHVDIPPNPGRDIIWLATDRHDSPPSYGKFIKVDISAY